MKKMFILLILFLLTLPLFVFADDEFVVSWPSDCNVYGVIKTASGRQGWNNTTNTFETWSDANIGYYDIPLTDVNGNIYVGDFNSSITAGSYLLEGYLKAGTDPNIPNDLWIAGPTAFFWDGSNEITLYSLWVDVNDIADVVWDEALSEHQTPGTAGHRLDHSKRR